MAARRVDRVARAPRRSPTRRDLQLPLVAFVVFFVVVSLFGEAREVNALPLLLPLAILGVAELETLPRGAASALDWFGMTTFFLLGALIWLGWVAAITGSPEPFAARGCSARCPASRYPFRFLAVRARGAAHAHLARGGGAVAALDAPRAGELGRRASPWCGCW